ncbi:uncharacterized protein RJT20DRAFT_1748 [Scheffersomyces xylosifermentans]|uniref:uncharacterized protein n=1 Tax=Scheffersomyces xylosifermentans TaxID=1304137 RepID=UPI00315D74B9
MQEDLSVQYGDISVDVGSPPEEAQVDSSNAEFGVEGHILEDGSDTEMDAKVNDEGYKDINDSEIIDEESVSQPTGTVVSYDNSEVPLIDATDEEDEEDDQEEERQLHHEDEDQKHPENPEKQESDDNHEEEDDDEQHEGHEEPDDEEEPEQVDGSDGEIDDYEELDSEYSRYDQDNTSNGIERSSKNSIINIDSESDIENLEELDESEVLEEVSRSQYDDSLNAIQGGQSNSEESDPLASTNDIGISGDKIENLSDPELADEDNENENETESTTGQEEVQNRIAKTKNHNVPIILKVAEIEFLVCPIDSASCDVDCSHLVSLYDDRNVLHCTVEDFFGLLRSNEDLKEIHDFPLAEEIVLDVPELGNIRITEDNIYSRDVTVNDFIDTFVRLGEKTSDKSKIPETITFNLTTQSRFITSFNKLSEIIREEKGFESIVAIGQSTSEEASLKHGLENEEPTVDKKKQRVS